MTTETVTIQLSEINNVSSWTLILDDKVQTFNGKQRHLNINSDTKHRIRLDFEGTPGGFLTIKLFYKGKVIKSREPAKIPSDSTVGFDYFDFRV